MTEPTEQDTPEEAPADTTAETEAPDTPEQPSEEEEAAEQEQAEQPPQEDTLKAIQRIEKLTTNERDRHAKKLSDILGEASTDVLPCPLCFDGLMGFVLPGDAEHLPDEQLAAALAFLGQAPPADYREAEGVAMCDRCDGLGKLRYPTRVEHVELQNCPKCGSSGYITLPPPTPEPVAAWTPTAVPTNAGGAQPLACPLCGAQGMAGQPHYCAPKPAPAGV